MRIARLFATALIATFLLVLAAGPARAHNSLTKAEPAKNATLGRAPTGVKLTFLQKVDPAALTITVTDAGQNRMAAGPPVAEGRTGAIVFRAPLPDGVYTVTYRVVSLDGHPVQGSYRFTVGDRPGAAVTSAAPGTSVPATSASSAAAPPPEAAAGPVEKARAWPVIAGTAAVVAVLGAGALVLGRRRRAT